jgi:hypothetical protein
VLANPNTGLQTPDVFYFGNAIGESGYGDVAGQVELTDALTAWSFQHLPPKAAGLGSPLDFNRDNQIDYRDFLTAWENSTDYASALLMFWAPPQGRPTTALFPGLTPVPAPKRVEVLVFVATTPPQSPVPADAPRVTLLARDPGCFLVECVAAPGSQCWLQLGEDILGDNWTELDIEPYVSLDGQRYLWIVPVEQIADGMYFRVRVLPSSA